MRDILLAMASLHEAVFHRRHLLGNRQLKSTTLRAARAIPRSLRCSSSLKQAGTAFQAWWGAMARGHEPLPPPAGPPPGRSLASPAADPTQALRPPPHSYRPPGLDSRPWRAGLSPGTQVGDGAANHLKRGEPAPDRWPYRPPTPTACRGGPLGAAGHWASASSTRAGPPPPPAAAC